MAKVFDSRPDDWADKDKSGAKSQSSVSEYKSGKVQKNIVSDDSIVQEELAEGKKKKLISSSKVEEISKGNIYNTYEDDTKIYQQSKSAKETFHAKDYKSETKQETTTIQAKSRVETIMADSTTISDNILTETGSGKHTITATKNINLKSNKATISTDKLNVKSAGFRVTAKNQTEKAPFKNINAGSIKYNIGSKMVIDGDMTKSSFKLQEYQVKQAEYKHPDDNADDIYYIGDVIYSPKQAKLYFVPTNLVRDIFNSQAKYLSKSKTNSIYRNNFAKRQVANRFDTSNDLEQVILANKEYIHISFVRSGICMLDQSVLDSMSIADIDFDKDKHLDGDTYLINWGAIGGDLESKVKGLGFKGGYQFANQQAVNNGIEHLQNLSETNINRWLDIGKTTQSSMLYMGLMLAGRYNFKQLAETYARLPYKPDLIADIDYDNEKAITHKSYQHQVDEEYGVFELVATEEYVDSQVLLSQKVKVAVKDDKYVLEGENHDQYPTAKDNQIVDGILHWSRAANTKNSKKIEKLNLGRLKIKDLQSKQLTNPYQLDYKDDKWLIYADSKYLLSTHNKDQDYPEGDALIFDATVGERYSLEKFYYYQEARQEFELDETIIAKTIKQMLGRRANYQALVDTYAVPNDEEIKKHLESLQENGKTKDIESVIAELEKADDELILALVPESVGKLLYLLNNPSKASQKAIEDSIELSERVLKMCIKLLSTFRTRKGYLIALKHYQPLNEYDEVDPVKSVDHLWNREEDMLSIEDSSLQRKINGLYNEINSEEMTLKLRKDRDLFYKHEYLEITPATVMLTRDAEDIIHDLKEEDQEDTSQPLTDLPDKDASVLCELVYEEEFLEAVIRQQKDNPIPLSQAIYKKDKKSLIDDLDKVLSVDKHGDLNIPFADYSNYYYPILAKYKIVTTSSKLKNTVGYYGIAIANAKDSTNSGIYVINRGTRQDTLEAVYHDLVKSDVLDMGILGKSMPVTIISEHAKAGIEFGEDLLKDNNLKYIGFSGHSLGGSITQMQAVYFADRASKGVNLSPSKGFEPFGVENEVAPRISHITEGHKIYYMTLNPLKALNSAVCMAGIDWNCNSWQGIADKLVVNYVGYKPSIKFTAFGRKGDLIANLAHSIGNTVNIDSAGSTSDFLELHSMSNYRYQGYTADGSLINTLVNITNSNILKSSDNTEQKIKYRLCFGTPTFTNHEEL
ncbi:hypothetical protein LO80_01915 [Candidatus Francisella endociliophora]|uniref:Uncharacterized protein n=1 Tax=Candidatus Francisella endociliophora TaxID=653937 RepID=A0A097EMR6_9GAMM|nr:hypothetical protein [Francisella sp. FSC1006]AIT08855.1 hypothetical protein LO80_01915 [Francisella sp. FSC1006]